ncbi:hypothetical protein DFR29_117131 [Tahibacter aquaticus]|uniref:Secreted protein (IPTL-CTERM system target) n=1 Tax=Tahibacter aquaticus TaxID=520092 RepID=A0A4V3DLE8_9GAMM|nr:hypothetical protein [Tahibacter aquaticus]TDR39221.1 hypothetical protein DFR29_117131 [Tahibacter aquaticus]
MKPLLARLLMTLCAFLFLGDAQAYWTVQSWNYAPEIAPRLTLVGMSPSSCIPEQASVSLAGNVITVHLSPEPTVCFSAFRPWDLSVDMRGIPSGHYRVDVTEGSATHTLVTTFEVDIVFMVGAPETVPAASPAMLAFLAVLLCLGAAWMRRRRGAWRAA